MPVSRMPPPNHDMSGYVLELSETLRNLSHQQLVLIKTLNRLVKQLIRQCNRDDDD